MAKKVVLVTGASRGIGKAIAVKFAKKGYNVIINCAHREQELMQTKKEIESYQVTCTAFLKTNTSAWSTSGVKSCFHVNTKTSIG